MSSVRRYLVALLLSVVATSSYVYGRDLFQKYQAQEEIEKGVKSLQQQRDALLAERDALQKRVDVLDDDPVEIEATIRRTKHLVRVNERVYRVELPEERTLSAPEHGVDNTTGSRDTSSKPR